MSALSAYVPDEQAMLVSIFYKIGIWMSHIDDSGEEEADSAEEIMLIRVLESVAKTYKNIPLISEMAVQSVYQESNHARWAAQSDNAVAEAVRAGKMLKTRLSPEEMEAYKKACMHVATAVATAVEENEFGETAHVTIREKVGRFFSNLKGGSLKDEMNISPTEDSALTDLANALSTV